VGLSEQKREEETFASFLVDGHTRYVALSDIQRYPDSLLANICSECPDCLKGVPVNVEKDLSLFDWVIEVYKGNQHKSPLPDVPVGNIERELDFFRLPGCTELQLYRRADWHRKRRMDSIRSLTSQILELLATNSPLKSSFEFLLFWNQDRIWTDSINVELLWKHTEPQYYSEESAILNVLFKSGFVRPWTCTKIFTSAEHLFMENRPKNWSMGFPILTEVTLIQFNEELQSYGFTMSQEFAQVCIGSDSFVKDVRIPYIRVSY